MQKSVATFYIGHNVKGRKTWDHKKQVLPALQSAFPKGFTAWPATGGWDGGVEATTVCQVVGLSSHEAFAARRMLEFAFSQEVVLCTFSVADII